MKCGFQLLDLPNADVCYMGEVTSLRKDMTSNAPFRFGVEFGVRRDVDKDTMSAVVKLAKEFGESHDILCSSRVEQKAPRSVSWRCTLKFAESARLLP